MRDALPGNMSGMVNGYEVQCTTLHPRGCGAPISGDSVDSLVDAAIEHGARAHGFTPAFYDQKRVAAMRATLGRILGGEPRLRQGPEG